MNARNQLDRLRDRLLNSGTSEGVRKAWETRRHGGGIPSNEHAQKILRFTSRFKDNPSGWSEATDELPDLHNYMAELVPGYKGHIFEHSGGEMPIDVRKDPAKRNQYHKQAIAKLAGMLHPENAKHVAEHFSWLSNRFMNTPIYERLHHSNLLANAGTSEGVRKAWETRKRGGGGYTQAQHTDYSYYRPGMTMAVSRGPSPKVNGWSLNDFHSASAVMDHAPSRRDVLSHVDAFSKAAKSKKDHTQVAEAMESIRDYHADGGRKNKAEEFHKRAQAHRAAAAGK